MSLYDELLKVSDKSVQFPKLLDRLAITNNILTNCIFELTPVCNFNCEFCYARVSPDELKRRGTKVMGFDEWKRYIDELSEMSCLTLAFTGGECTLHPDFVRIYDYAYDKGFVINVFTNGSYITDEILNVFVNKPPSRIFLTVYGDTPKTYEKVTGNAKYCEIVKNNVRRLVDKKLDVIIQGTFTVDNVEDTEAIYDFAASLGCEFRYTNQLQTYGHCTDEVLEEIKAKNESIQEASDKIWYKKRGLSPIPKEELPKKSVTPLPADPNARGIKCNAGKNSCFIRHDGFMLPCNTFDAFTVDTRGRSVKDCFGELNKWVSNITRILECESCIHAVHCTTCVAAHYNDTKQLDKPSPKICFKILEPEKAKKEREFFEAHGYIEI